MTERDASISCERCGTAAPAGSKYCESCGTRLPDAPPREEATANEPSAVFCEHCGARNEGGADYCEHCGRRLLAEAPTVVDQPTGAPPLPGGRRRALAAASAAVLLFVVGIAVVVAVTRDGHGHRQAGETFTPPQDTTPTTDASVTDTAGGLTDSTATGGLFPSTDAETDLDTHIPAVLSEAGCASDPHAPDDALAGAVCELTDQDLVVQYWLFPDTDSMYAAYDGLLADKQQVIRGDCPDELPAKTEWTSDSVTRGRWACYATALNQGNDAHIVWTHDDFLILSLLSHISVDPDTVSLLRFWSDSAGPE